MKEYTKQNEDNLYEDDSALVCEDCGAEIDNGWDGMFPILCFKCWRDRDNEMQ